MIYHAQPKLKAVVSNDRGFSEHLSALLSFDVTVFFSKVHCLLQSFTSSLSACCCSCVPARHVKIKETCCLDLLSFSAFSTVSPCFSEYKLNRHCESIVPWCAMNALLCVAHGMPKAAFVQLLWAPKSFFPKTPEECFRACQSHWQKRDSELAELSRCTTDFSMSLDESDNIFQHRSSYFSPETSRAALCSSKAIL